MIIYPQLLLLSESLTEPLSHARIGYENYAFLLTADDVTVSSETAEGPRDAPNRADTYSFWQPSALPATRDLDLGELKDLDYVGLVSNFGSAGVGVEVRISEDVEDFNDYLRISGGDGNYASTPDSVAASVTGDLHLELELSIEDADLPDFWLDFLGDFSNSVTKITDDGTFVRAGDTATRVNSNGLIETVLANVMREDYHPITRAIRGLALEDSGVNISLRSDDYNNAAWTKSDTTVTSDSTTGPDGNVSADLLTEGAAGTAIVSQGSLTITANATCCAPFWLKAGNHQWVRAGFRNAGNTNRCEVYFDVQNGVIGAQTNVGAATGTAGLMRAFPNGWYFCVVTGAINGGDTSANIYTASAAASGSTTRVNNATRYQWRTDFYNNKSGVIGPTTASAGSSVSRASDSPAMTDLNAIGVSATEGTFIAAAEMNALSLGTAIVADLDDGTTNNRIWLRCTSTGNVSPLVLASGVSQVNLNTTTVPVHTPFKHAFGFKADDFAVSLNGAAVVTDTAGTIPTFTQMGIGRAGSGGSGLGGWLRELYYYATRRVNATLVDMARGTYRVLASKWVESGNQRSWALCLKENCALVLFVSTAGTAATIREYHSAPLTFVEGTRFRIRVKLDIASGSDSVCTFETSDDDGATWDTLSTITQASVSGIFDSTAQVEVGAFNGGTSELDAKIFQFWLHATLADGPVLHFDAAEGETGDTSITSEDTGEVWTLHSTNPATALKIKRFSTPVAPADDAPIMFLDELKQARHVRLRLTGSLDADNPPRLAVCYVGPVLAMQRMIYGGHVPINLSRETELHQPLSNGGQFLGQTYRRLGVKTSASFRHLTAAWYRANFDPFVKHARRYPYFFAWRPNAYPLEVGYVWTDQDIAPSNMGKRDYMQVSWPMKGIGWE